MPGFGWGAVTALAVGVNGLLIAGSSRRIGSLLTTGVSIVIAFLFLCGYAVVVHAGFRVPLHEWDVIALLAGASAGFLVASYHSLSIGPVAVVSPLSATSGAVTAIAAFVVVGEAPDEMQWCGIVIAAVGAVLVSVKKEHGEGFRLVGPGPLFALVGVLMVSISNAGLIDPVRTIGAIQTIVVLRGFTITYVWIVLSGYLLSHRRGLRRGAVHFQSAGSSAALLIVVGFFDALSFIGYARGVAVAPAWLIALMSQSGRGISIVGGLVLFRERLGVYQWIGAVLLGAGVVLALA